MTNAKENHQRLTVIRAEAYEELFGGKPSAMFAHTLWTSSTNERFPIEWTSSANERFPIDVFIYTLQTKNGEIEVAVTNGMSDFRMAEPKHPTEFHRRELIQYFPKCTEAHALRLRDMALLPLFDGFHLDTHHTIAWEFPAIPGTPWKNAFFLLPLIRSHREFQFDIDGDATNFLWHIPISEEEREFKNAEGSNALVDRLEAVDLPWVFDETNRPSLLE